MSSAPACTFATAHVTFATAGRHKPLLRVPRIAAGATIVVVAALITGCGASTGGNTTPTAQRVGARVAVTALDTMRFDPSTLNVAAGATVTFSIHNAGSVAHEFVVGDQAMQDRHENGGNMAAMNSADGITVAPGQTKDFTYRFGAPGTLIDGCHEPGHYAAGMRGTIIVAT